MPTNCAHVYDDALSFSVIAFYRLYYFNLIQNLVLSFSGEKVSIQSVASHFSFPKFHQIFSWLVSHILLSIVGKTIFHENLKVKVK